MVLQPYRRTIFSLVSASIFLITVHSATAQKAIGPTPVTPVAVDSIMEDISEYPSASLADTLFYYPEELVADQIACLQKGIPLRYNKTIQGFINYFTVKKRSFTRTMLERKHVYFPIFEETLKRYNLPEELKYLSIVESGLNPKATSPARAVGLWQFISSTGREYGLRQDAYIDERMDPYKATEAGCRYLQTLYNMFDDWELALAAYNCGPGNVRRAIRRSGNKTGFWEIYSYLPRETRAYVPMFVAVTYVMNYYKSYNIRSGELVRYIASDTIHVNQHLDLAQLAEQLNVPLEDFKLLNPQLKKNVVPGYLKNYPLRIPKEVAPVLAARRQSIMDSLGKMPQQESVILLAKNTYIEELQEPSRTSTTSSQSSRKKIVHKVKRGDALGKLAELYNVAVADIRQWNRLRGNTIQAGQRLAIWVQEHTWKASNDEKKSISASLERVPTKGKVYMVQPGDTLWSISKGHGGISVDKIKRMNNLKTNELKPGQKLIIG